MKFLYADESFSFEALRAAGLEVVSEDEVDGVSG